MVDGAVHRAATDSSGTLSSVRMVTWREAPAFFAWREAPAFIPRPLVLLLELRVTHSPVTLTGARRGTHATGDDGTYQRVETARQLAPYEQ